MIVFYFMGVLFFGTYFAIVAMNDLANNPYMVLTTDSSTVMFGVLIKAVMWPILVGAALVFAILYLVAVTIETVCKTYIKTMEKFRG